MCLVEQVQRGRDEEGWGQDDEALCLGVTGVPGKMKSYQHFFLRCSHGEVDTNSGHERTVVRGLDLRDQRSRSSVSFRKVTTAENGGNERVKEGAEAGRVKRAEAQRGPEVRSLSPPLSSRWQPQYHHDAGSTASRNTYKIHHITELSLKARLRGIYINELWKDEQRCDATVGTLNFKLKPALRGGRPH